MATAGESKQDGFLRIFKALDDDLDKFGAAAGDRDQGDVLQLWLLARLALIEQRLDKSTDQNTPPCPAPVILKLYPPPERS